MSKGFQQFLQHAADKPKISNQLKSAADENTFVELALVLGKENGFDFNAMEVRSALAALTLKTSSELSEAELEAVAGGDGNLSGFAAYLASLQNQGNSSGG